MLGGLASRHGGECVSNNREGGTGRDGEWMGRRRECRGGRGRFDDGVTGWASQNDDV